VQRQQRQQRQLNQHRFAVTHRNATFGSQLPLPTQLPLSPGQRPLRRVAFPRQALHAGDRLPRRQQLHLHPRRLLPGSH